jgi:hypothetical protein
MRFLLFTLILAGLLSAGKPAEVKKEEITLFSEAGRGSVIVRPRAEFSGKQPTDTLYYYLSVNYTAIGLTNGGTYEAAIRLTPTELGPYNNWRLIKVRFYHYQGSHNGQVKIYDQGTSSAPGSVITTQTYSAPTAGWIEIPLTTPVTINNTRDLWVSVEITHAAGEYPISVDQGPAVAGKGDFVYAASLGWGELRNYNLDYNWNIEAIVQLPGDPGDPLPPENLTAYSDCNMPTSMRITWTDPTSRVNGTPLDSFRIKILRVSETNPNDTVFVDTVRNGIQQYVNTGLTDGVRYTYILQTWTYDDSLSLPVSISWYAGGDPWPAPPTLNAVNVVDDSTIEIVGVTPRTQRDGTPLDDLSGIKVYINNSFHHLYSISDTGVTFRDTVIVTPGQVSVYLTAVDNETPSHESDPSQTITVITNVHAGGPDGFGYTFKDSDYPTGPHFLWYDTQSGQVISLGDDAYTTINLPFAFPFYDRTLTQINLCSNGFLSTSTLTTYLNRDLPYDTIPYLIAFFWDDLNPSAGGQIRYLATPDYAVIHFENVPHFGTTQPGTYNMQVILYPNGDIAMSYLSMVGTLNSSTIGIQGNGGQNNWYLKYTYNGDPTVVHDSLTIYWKRPISSHDLSAGAFLNIPDLMQIAQITPMATIRNIGASPENNVSVELLIKKGTVPIYGDTVTIATIDTNVIDTLTFEPFTPPSTGFDYQAVLSILYTDDDPTNNSINKNFIVYATLYDFEEHNGDFSAAAGTQWEWGVPTSGPGSAHSGQKCWATVLSGDYPNSANWSLYSPLLIATQDAPTFAFYHWYDFEAYTTTAYDGGNLALSVNGGPYTLITPRGGYPRNSVVGLGNEPGYSGSTAGWELAIFDLPQVHANDTFRIRFRFGSDASITGPGWYIDDFIFGDFISSITEGENLPLSVSMPTIFKGVITFAINSNKTQKVEITLYDVSGREVATIFKGQLNPGKHNITYNGGLAGGVYFVRISTEKSSEIKKIMVTR